MGRTEVRVKHWDLATGTMQEEIVAVDGPGPIPPDVSRRMDDLLTRFAARWAADDSGGDDGVIEGSYTVLDEPYGLLDAGQPDDEEDADRG